MEELSVQPGAGQSVAGVDLLSMLEQRWRMMADTIRRLRTEQSETKNRLQEQELRVMELEEELAQSRRLVQEMQTERAHIVSRIESLLSSFNELD